MTTPSLETLETQVLDYVKGNFHVAPSLKLARDTSLLDTSIVDSTGYLEIFSWIRDEYGVEVADNEMGPENFETAGAIARYLHRKLG